MNLEPELQQAIASLLNGINTYESDTWSSSLVELTNREVQLIASKLITNYLFDEEGTPGNFVDGILITELYEDINESS